MPSRTSISGVSLAMAIVLLPFSIIGCHLALGVFILSWLAGGDWREKKERLAANPLVWTYVVLFLLHLAGTVYSENTVNAWYNIEKKITLLFLPVVLATLPPLGKDWIRFVLLAFVATCLAATLVCLASASTYAGPGNFDS